VLLLANQPTWPSPTSSHFFGRIPEAESSNSSDIGHAYGGEL
jgi:hypothetical protein